MGSWGTYPWSNFCDPHWELICWNKWHPETSEISTPPAIATGRHFYVWHGTKPILVFWPVDEVAFWLLLPGWVSLLSGGTVQPENTYFCILKVTGQVWKSQKRISINSKTNNKIIFSFNQPNRKRWGARLVDVIKHLPHKVFFVWHHHEKGGQPRLKRHILPIR